MEDTLHVLGVCCRRKHVLVVLSINLHGRTNVSGRKQYITWSIRDLGIPTDGKTIRRQYTVKAT